MDDLVERARAALDGVTPESWHPEYCEASNVWHIDAGAYPIGTEICKCKSDANARFIAAARSLVPEMADRIAALQSDLARAEAKLAEARANGLREAAQECQRLAESYTRSLSGYDEDHPQRGKIKWGAAALTVAAENILARIKEGE